jgi:hypothetical protein
MMKDKNARLLLEILQDHAPTGIEQEICSKLFREAQMAMDNTERILAGALYDGLAYGNWPWTYTK